MSESETQTTSATEETTASVTVSKKKCPRFKWMVTAVVIVVLIILGVLYQLEKEGRSSTHLFTTLIERQEANKAVATVNNETIKNSELQTSIQQFTQMATAQGVDTTSAETQAEIKKQALEVLINTTLLKQEASSRGISVTDEEVTERLTAIKDELGGEEVLAGRMAELGIDQEKLQSDVKDELTIQKLLDQVFAEANIQVTEEEIASVYEGAGGTEAGLPALEEVRPQIEAQITSSKEQGAIDDFLSTLKEKATIETKE